MNQLLPCFRVFVSRIPLKSSESQSTLFKGIRVPTKTTSIGNKPSCTTEKEIRIAKATLNPSYSPSNQASLLS